MAVAPVSVALGLLAFHLVTGPWATGGRWFAVGAADAALIRHGEAWRTVTALTLHADLGHVLANAVALALFGAALCSVLGAGLALLLVLLGGTLANALGAGLRTSAYVGVGASTAVFASVGLLAGAALTRPTPGRGNGRAAIVSGVLLLVLLGMNEASDVLAHVLGFAVGLPMGMAVGRLSGQAPGRAWQIVLAVAAAAILAASWWLALSAGVP
jgi:membrane associated rhomboid family serine protease